MSKWKLTDCDETGYEYECPNCKRHIGTRRRGIGLPSECPACHAEMDVGGLMTGEEAAKQLVDLYAAARRCGVWDSDKGFAEAVALAVGALTKDGEG